MSVLCGWEEICELLNRWKLLYRPDTGEKYGYAETMLEQGYDDLSQLVNMSDEELEKLPSELGMKRGHGLRFVDSMRKRLGMRQVRAELQNL